ncbi:MAG: vanadium-dependent haloperoxidase [Bryobacteraceae bacterium]
MKRLRIALWGGTTLLSLALNGNAQNVVTNWNAIASTSIVTTGGIGPAASSVWFAYTNIAVYDAVNAVHGRKFEPFYYFGSAAAEASDEAAALAAAHRVLVYYFPAQQTTLDAQFAASLSALTSTPRAKTDGILTGEAAAEALISERTGDGLNASVTYSQPSDPGVWEPNPPGSSPVTPWLGQMRPFTMRSADQFLPDGPTALNSEEWVADYNLTRLFGGFISDLRTPAQTEIGQFWTAHTAVQYSQAFNGLAQQYKLDLLDSARLMAILWTGYADAAIGCFNGKYTYNFWRPWAAIPAGGANSELLADATWKPLAATPNHPEYPAAHGCVTGAVTNLVADYFHTRKVHVVINSSVFSDGVHTHTFEDVGDWLNEVYWARIFAGFHFNHSLQDGMELGRQVAHQLVGQHFRVEDERDRH